MPSDFLDFLDHFLTLLAASLPGPLHRKEKLHEVPLDEMIKRSKIVAIGKVLRIKDPLFHKMAVATIEIEQIIVGNFEDKQIDITYYPRSNFEARFVLNERCIFLIDERNTIVKGYAGKIPIEKDKVEVHYILGEPVNQTLKDFKQRIKDTKSRQNTTGNLYEVPV
jgi:hypothetical protein